MKFRLIAVALALLSFLCLSLSPATRADMTMGNNDKPMHGHMMMMHGKMMMMHGKTMRHRRHHRHHGMAMRSTHGSSMMKMGGPMHKMDNNGKM